jgi:NTE family protein
MRVGLVLGAGGVVGASWLIGAIDALADETGWDPSTADRIVGTSAGSVIGALVAEGIRPEYLSAYVSGGTMDDVDESDERARKLAERLGGPERIDEIAERVSGDAFRIKLAPPPIGPGSWRMAFNTLRNPLRHSPAAVMAGWLPRGFISTGPISELVETFIAGGWPDHPSYWAIAADYCTGKRVAFGREDAPPATVGDAVAASCAIPGFYFPPKIAGRRYVDGGICSMSNLDMVRGEELDLVVCLNPTSSVAEAMGGTPGERIGALIRAASGRRLGHEARKLREAGTEVLILQPGESDVRRMGLNLMARGRRVEVMEHARRSVALALRDLRGSGAVLPGPVRKPARARAARSGRAHTTAGRSARRSAA